MKKLSMLLLLAVANNIIAQSININFPGQNAYLHPTPCADYGSTGNHWGDIKNSGVKFIRIGGISYDKCLRTAGAFDRFDIGGLIDSGFTPIVQLSYYKSPTQVWTDPDSAAKFLLDSVVVPLYGKRVRYFSIGNEPNQNPDYRIPNKGGFRQDSAKGIYDYIRAISKKIKSVYRDSVRILGPELSYYQEGLVNALTSGPTNILPFINMFTFHYYPLGNEGDTAEGYDIPATRDNIINVIRKGTGVYFADTSLGKATPLETRLDSLNARIAPYKKVTAAITEANICYQNDVNGTNPAEGTDDSITGNGTNGFLAGQLWAELMAVGMSKSVSTINFWSVREGSANDSFATDIGYISSRTGAFKPTYHHFQMIAQHFKGQFKWGALTAFRPHKVKAFASKHAGGIAVMVMNQELSSSGSRPVHIRLNGNSIAGGTDVVKINVGFGINKIYKDSIKGEETLLILFDGTGNFLEKKIYNLFTYEPALASINGQAYEGSQSSVMKLSDHKSKEGKEMSFEVVAVPNPAKLEFRLLLNSYNIKDKVTIRIFDQAGRLLEVKNNLSVGQTVIIGSRYSQGTYLVEARQNTRRATVKIIKTWE